MINLRNFSTIIPIVMLSTIIANAQSGSDVIKHFEKYNVSFDYPAYWKLTESSTDDVQNFTIATGGSAAQIAVIVQPDPGISCASEARSQSATTALVDWVAVQIHTPVPVQSALVPISIGQKKVPAVELHGVMNNKPVTAYIGSLVVHHYFVNVLYLKNDNDESGTTAWETVRTSLRIAEPGPDQKGSRPPESGGILNGKALSLFHPEYPIDARRQRASGTVVVEVEIDESGIVTLACAISGDQLLRAASVTAAKRSRFTPTKLSSKPVRVGVIQYKFVTQ